MSCKIALGVLLAIVCSCTLQDAAACIPSPNISVIPSLCTCHGCHSTVNFTVNLTDSTICLSGDFNIDIFHHGQTLLLHPKPAKSFDQILHICYVSLLIENGTSFFGRSDLVLTEEYDNSILQVILRTNPHLCSNNFTLRVQGILDPVNINDSAVNCSGIYISWEGPISLSCVPIHYIVHVLELNYTDITTNEHYMINVPSYTHMMVMQYTISIKAANEVGISNDSTTIITWSACPVTPTMTQSTITISYTSGSVLVGHSSSMAAMSTSLPITPSPSSGVINGEHTFLIYIITIPVAIAIAAVVSLICIASIACICYTHKTKKNHDHHELYNITQTTV